MNPSFLERRVTHVFGIFMIFIYATLGVLLAFDLMWSDLPRHKVIGVVLLMWAAFRTYMLFRFRSRMKNNNTDEIR